MQFDWSISHYDYRNRIRNLDKKAQGVVKSDKFFPVFLEDGKEKIFKPLSKTKPLSTPYFAYSEVFWSTVIHEFFDPETPIYKLAICQNIEDDFENKYHHGTIVDSLEKPSMEIINLYEIFRDNPDPEINILTYQNCCGQFYDYTSFFETKLMRENKELGQQFAKQVLLSILKLDQNYHYENPLFYMKDNKVQRMTPMIDHEFSSMFLFLDALPLNLKYWKDGMDSLIMPKSDPSDIFQVYRYEAFASLSRNLDVILSTYPDISLEFLENLKRLIQEFQTEPFQLEDHQYLTPFSSENYKIGKAEFKKKDKEQAESFRETIPQSSPKIEEVSVLIYREVLETSKILKQEMEKRLIK